MLINPILLVIATAVAFAITRALRWHPNLAPMLIAAAIGLVASEIALLPTLLRPRKNPADEFQQAFLGTVLHLGLAAVLGAVAVFVLKPGDSFVYWLLGLYWITLIGLCVVFVGILRAHAPSAATPAA